MPAKTIAAGLAPPSPVHSRRIRIPASTKTTPFVIFLQNSLVWPHFADLAALRFM
jgi:hypothetical protein